MSYYREEKNLSLPLSVRLIFFFTIILLPASYHSAFSQEIYLSPQVGHTKGICSIALSPDERLAVSAGADGKLVIWDLRTMKVLYVWTGHESDQFLGKYPVVRDVAWSSNGKYIASVGEDGNLIVWEASSGKIVCKDYQGQRVISVEFSEDSKSVFIGLEKGEIKVYKVEFDEVFIPFGSVQKPNRYAGSLVGHQEGIISIKRISAGRLLSVSSDIFEKRGSIKVWDIENKKELKTIAKVQEDIYDIAVVPDRDYVAAVGSGKTIAIWQISSGKMVRNIKFTAGDYARYSLEYSPDGKTLVLSGLDGIRFFDVATGKLKQTSKVAGLNLTCLEKEPTFLSVFDSQIRVLDAEKGMLLRESESFEFGSAMERVAAHPNEKIFVTAGGDGKLRIWDMKTGSLKNVIDCKCAKIIDMKISPDGKIIIATDGTDIKVFETESGKLKRFISKKMDKINAIAISRDGKEIVSGSDDGTVRIWDIESGEQMESIPVGGRVISVAVEADNKTLFCGNALSELKRIHRGRKAIEDFYGKYSGQVGKIPMIAVHPTKSEIITADFVTSDPKQWNVETLALKRILGEAPETENKRNVPKIPKASSLSRARHKDAHTGRVLAVAYSPDGREVATGSADRMIKIWDAENGTCLKTLKGHSGDVSDLSFTPDGKYLISGSADGTAKFWNRKTGECITFSANIDQWIAYTDDGYWDGSERCENLVAMVKGMESWNIDQFAVKNNRPDIILKRLGYASSDEVAYFQKQYEKRARRLTFKKDELSGEKNVPTSKILEAITKDKTLELRLEFSENERLLKNYNIYVNNVPIFGGLGKKLEGKKQEIFERVELSAGINKVEISCINEAGVESFRALTYSQYEKPVKKNLYYLGFGVSKYKNPALNLDYADKDATDLEITLKKLKGRGFDEVYTRLYLNENVMPRAIDEAREFLKQAKVDDVVILFIAGHGMHSQDVEGNYYFLTSNAEMDNLENTAAEFELIEGLLQGIQPRSKLFLIDACESGELDELEARGEMSVEKRFGIKSRGIKKEERKESKNFERRYLYDRNRYVYNDLTRRTGAIVFSSSKGSELSYESREMENGLFTEYIIRAFSTNEADENKDGSVSVEELRKYVSSKVSLATNGMQNPTVDRDNIFQKFSFKIK